MTNIIKHILNLFIRNKTSEEEHPHELTQYEIPNEDDIKIDPNVTNVFKNIRDELGSLNANISNYNKSSNRLGTIMAWLTGAIALYSIIQIIILFKEIEL